MKKDDIDLYRNNAYLAVGCEKGGHPPQLEQTLESEETRPNSLQMKLYLEINWNTQRTGRKKELWAIHEEGQDTNT